MNNQYLRRNWIPCKICQWGNDSTTQDEYTNHCKECKLDYSNYKPSIDFEQFLIKHNKKMINYAYIVPIVIMGFPKIGKTKFAEQSNKIQDCQYKVYDCQSFDEFKNVIDDIFRDTYESILPIVFLPSDGNTRQKVFTDPILMRRCKTFLCYPEISGKDWYCLNRLDLNIDDITKEKLKKDILELKLDDRFFPVVLKRGDYFSDKIFELMEKN